MKVRRVACHHDDLEPIACSPFKVTFANRDVRQDVLNKNGYPPEMRCIFRVMHPGQ